MVERIAGATSGRKEFDLSLRGIRVAEGEYCSGFDMPPHSHGTTNVTLVLAGEFRETAGASTRWCGPGNVLIKPARTTHADRFGPGTVRTLVIEISDEAATVGDRPGPRDSHYRWLRGGPLRGSLWNFFVSLRGTDERIRRDAALAALGLVFQTIRRPPAESVRESPPRRVADARAYIEQNYGSTLRVQDLARRFGTHPVYLTRLFRRHLGTSISSYIRAVRARCAALALTRTGSPLSNIAQLHGFADQAHLTRAFKLEMGITPGAYRRLLQ